MKHVCHVCSGFDRLERFRYHRILLATAVFQYWNIWYFCSKFGCFVWPKRFDGLITKINVHSIWTSIFSCRVLCQWNSCSATNQIAKFQFIDQMYFWFIVISIEIIMWSMSGSLEFSPNYHHEVFMKLFACVGKMVNDKRPNSFWNWKTFSAYVNKSYFRRQKEQANFDHIFQKIDKQSYPVVQHILAECKDKLHRHHENKYLFSFSRWFYTFFSFCWQQHNPVPVSQPLRHFIFSILHIFAKDAYFFIKNSSLSEFIIFVCRKPLTLSIRFYNEHRKEKWQKTKI